jgi:hypothetical protein
LPGCSLACRKANPTGIRPILSTLRYMRRVKA